MPANNSKIMSNTLLDKLNSKYKIEYDEETNMILVGLTTCKRKTLHDASKPFHISSKIPKRKICFNTPVIDIWIELQKDDKTKDISLFDVQNASTELKVMYQKVTMKKVVELIRKKFEGIKKI